MSARFDSHVASVIVAAGNSVRMGSPKALLPIGKNSTFVQNIGKALVGAGIRRLYLTVPNVGASAIEDALGCDVPLFATVANRFPKRGMLGSVQSVLLEKNFQASALLICPVDMPFLTVDLVQSFLNVFEQSKNAPQSILATHRGAPGHPFLLSKHYFAEILSLGDDDSLRRIINLDSRNVTLVESDDPRILCNINTPADYAGFVNPSVNIFDAAAIDAPGVKSV